MFLCIVASVYPLLCGGEDLRLSTASQPPPRSRVIAVEDSAATDAYQPNPEVIRRLVNRGITRFAGKTNVAAAWQTLLATQDVVGIKVYSLAGPRVGTRVAVVEGVIEGLIAARVQPTNIIVWDRRLSDLRRAGFTALAERHGVHLAGSVDAGWDTNTFYESPLLGNLVFGDQEFQKKDEGVGRKSFVTRLLSSRITKIINISPLLNHNSAGVCGSLYSLAMGSVDNTIRFEGDPGRLSIAVPEIYALPQISDQAVLHVVDALICQYQGEQISHLHYSAPLNQLRFSTDPVALDALSIQELQRQRTAVHGPSLSRTNGLHLLRNAELLELGIADPRRIDFDLQP